MYSRSVLALGFLLAAVSTVEAAIWSANSAIPADYRQVASYRHPRFITADNGWVYLACERRTTGSLVDDVAVFRSKDGGRTWDYGIALNVQTVINGGAPISNNTFLPDIALRWTGSRVEGMVAVQYEDPLSQAAAGQTLRDIAYFPFTDTGGNPNWSYPVQTIGELLVDEYRPAVTFTGQQWVIAYASNFNASGRSEVQVYRTSSFSGAAAYAQTLQLPENAYIAEQLDMDTLIAPGVNQVYLCFSYRISSTDANHNILAARSNNHGAGNSWVQITDAPNTAGVDYLFPSIAATKDASGKKAILTYIERPVGEVDFRLAYRLVGSGDTAFGTPVPFTQRTGNMSQPSVCADKAAAGDVEKFHLAWYGNYGGSQEISTIDLPVTATVPTGAVDKVSDSFSVPWINWVQDQRMTAVTWVNGLNGVEPIVAWSDSRNRQPNSGLPTIYMSHYDDGITVPTPTPGVFTPTGTPSLTPTATRPPQSFTPSPTPTQPNPRCCWSRPFSDTLSTTQSYPIKSCRNESLPDHDLRLTNNKTFSSGAGDLQVCLMPVGDLLGTAAYQALGGPQKLLTYAWVLQAKPPLAQARLSIEFFGISTQYLSSGMTLSDVDSVGFWTEGSSGWFSVPVSIVSTASTFGATVSSTIDVFQQRVIMVMGKDCGGIKVCTGPTSTPTLTPTATPRPPCPGIALAGYWNSTLDSSLGGFLRLVAIPAPGNESYIDGVEVLAGGIPTGLSLRDDGNSGDFGARDGVWGTILPLDGPLGAGVIPLEVGIRSRGRTCQRWPYLTVQ